MPKLPDKPSDLIEVALVDLEKAEASSKYVVDMSVWHEPDIDEELLAEADEIHPVCHVCLAGSVMAFTLGAHPEVETFPSDHDEECKLSALNEFRAGAVVTGLLCMKIIGNWNPSTLSGDGLTPQQWRTVRELSGPAIRYEDDRDAFKQQMRRMAAKLRVVGL